MEWDRDEKFYDYKVCEHFPVEEAQADFYRAIYIDWVMGHGLRRELPIEALCPFMIALQGVAVRESCRGDMFAAAHDLHKSIMPALENVARLGVLAAVRAGGSLTKNDLVHRLGMSEINVRRHLKVLEECGLVTRNGALVEYRAPEDQLAQLFVQEAFRLFFEQNNSLAPSQFTNVDGGARVVVDRIPFANFLNF